MTKPLIVLGALLPLLAACGPADKLAVASIAYDVDGAGDARLLASAVAVDTDGEAAWLATHAAGGSAIASPDDRLPLNVCVKVGGKVRASGLQAFRALEMGSVTVQSPAGPSVAVPTTAPLLGEGVVYSGAFTPEELPFEPGGQYAVQTSGSPEVPAIAVGITAPPRLDVKKLGMTNPGPGILAIPRTLNVTIEWGPPVDDSELFLLFETNTASLVCRVADNGEFTVSRDQLSHLPTGEGLLQVERVYDAAFTSDAGADGRSFPGRVRMAVRRSFTVNYQ